MNVFCSGIGGIGLSAVARLLAHQGHAVSGSDLGSSDVTDRLKSAGMNVIHEQVADNVHADLDLFIYSEAIPEDNPERVKARELGIESINYATALGRVSEGHKTIAVCGTHGKTTLTGMLTSIFLQTDLDPSIVIGSQIDLLDGLNFRAGQGEWFLAEACEYRENFLELQPTVVIINNLEPDHLDYFETEERYYEAYQSLCEKVPAEGVIILWKEDATHLNTERFQASLHFIDDHQQQSFELSVPGEHNQLNARVASTVSEWVGVDQSAVNEGLKHFQGTKRRFERKGIINGAVFYDDYGHHPTEIKATLQATQERHPDKDIVLVFQPHQYSRTRAFFDEFVEACSGAHEVWITDIYQARDSQEDLEATSAEDLAHAITEAHYVSFDQLAGRMTESANSQKVFLVMGAGNITRVFQELTFE